MPAKQLILAAARAIGLSALAERATRAQLRILCYHGLWVTPGAEFGDCLFISPEQFAARMTRLKRSGRPVLPLGEAVERLARDDLPPGAAVITIDDGWASTHSHMLPVLEALGLPATLYATTWYAGRALPVVNVTIDYFRAVSARGGNIDRDAAIAAIERLPVDDRLAALRRLGGSLGVGEAWLETRQFNIMSAAELADCARRGIAVELHTHRHIDVALRLDALADEIAENRAFLAAADPAIAPAHFCYPSGVSVAGARALLAAQGVRSATLVTEGLNAPGADPYFLRRFLDGRSIGEARFDAYLSGTLHLLAALRGRAGVTAPQALPA